MVAEEGRAVLGCGVGCLLGNGTYTHRRMPTQASGLVEQLDGARVVMVAAGSLHSSASRSEGYLLTFGYGKDGQLGHGNREVRTVPAKLGREVFGGSAVTMVSCEWRHTMVVTEAGRLFTFASGQDGKLGHGDTNDRDVPVEVGAARF
jgi:alpha-tubulin suppressor-like RCC1 family protein